MANHEVEIIITSDGQVKAHVKGAKGKACMEYAKWLESVVGRISNQQLTSEYYEPETKSKINLRQDLNVQE